MSVPSMILSMIKDHIVKASLESKYTYLFHLISGVDGVDHKRLAVLFYDLIHVRFSQIFFIFYHSVPLISL